MNNLPLPAYLMIVLSLLTAFGFYSLLQYGALRATLPAKPRNSRMTYVWALFFLWFAVHGILAKNGFYTINGLPPRPVLAMLLGVALLTAWSFSNTGKAALTTLPLHGLLYLQGFRILVEALLFLGYRRGLLPVQMTFEGANFDIISGIAGPLAGMLVQRNARGTRGIVIAYNILGLILLLNVLQVAVRSMPTPLRTYTNAPDLSIVGTFPFIYLPVVLVVIAMAAHIFSLRQLYLKKKPASGQEIAQPEAAVLLHR
jgi:hypothetical protein